MSSSNPPTIPSQNDLEEGSSRVVGQSAVHARPQIQITAITVPAAPSTITGVNISRPHVHSPLILTSLGALNRSPDSLSASSPSLIISPPHLDNHSSDCSAVTELSTISSDHALYLISSFPSNHPICLTTMPPGQDGRVIDLKKSRCPICCELHVYLSRLLSIKSEKDNPFTVCDDCQEQEARKDATRAAAQLPTKQESGEQKDAVAKEDRTTMDDEACEPIANATSSAKGAELLGSNHVQHKPGGKGESICKTIQQPPVPHGATAKEDNTSKVSKKHEFVANAASSSEGTDSSSIYDRHAPRPHRVGEPVYMASTPSSTPHNAATKEDQQLRADDEHELIANTASSSEGTKSSSTYDRHAPRPTRPGEPIYLTSTPSQTPHDSKNQENQTSEAGQKHELIANGADSSEETQYDPQCKGEAIYTTLKGSPAPPESSVCHSEDALLYNPRRNTVEYSVLPKDYFIGHHLARHLADPKRAPLESVTPIRISTKTSEQSVARATDEPPSPPSPEASPAGTAPVTTDHSSDSEEEPPRGRTLKVRGSQKRALNLDMRYRLREISRRVLSSTPATIDPSTVREVLASEEHKALAKFLLLPSEDATPTPRCPTDTNPDGTSKRSNLGGLDNPDALPHKGNDKPDRPLRRTTFMTFGPNPERQDFASQCAASLRSSHETTPDLTALREPIPSQVLQPRTRAPSLDQVLVAGSSRRASLLQYVLTMDTYAAEMGLPQGVSDGEEEGKESVKGDSDEDINGNEDADSVDDWEKRFLGYRDTFARLESPGPKGTSRADEKEEADEEEDGQGKE